MAYIKDVQVGSDVYLIEPALYIAPSKNGAAYTAALTNFSLVTGATVQAKFAATNDANATLNVNSTGAKEIHYNGAKITASQFKTNHVYTLVYDGTQWQVVGDIDTNTWRGIENSLTSDSTSVSLSAAQGKALKGLIDAMDATTPAASGNATAFIDSITQTDGKITSITKKNIPTISSSTAGLAPKGTAVSTQSTSTKFLREDGNWAVPSYTTNTDAKVAQSSNTEDKEFPIILKNTNNTTNETNGVKYAGGVTVNPSDKTVTATEFIGNIKANRVQPTIVKNWTSTSFYGANISGQDVHDLSTFWMLSVKPDSWYEPWVVRFKITTTCPAAANYYSVTYCMYSGRADGIVVFNWNERYDHAHYYTNVRTLKKAGFDAGLGHAIGINLYASNNYTNANYYRSFKLEYYDCDNCTVTILDTPIKWANWPDGTTTNYNGNNNANAVDRGLQESGDANSYDLLQMSNNYIKNGAFRFPGISMFGYDREGHAQAFSLYQSGYTSYTASVSNKETRIYNTNGIDWTRGIHYNTSGGSWAENADMNITTRLAQSAVDLRYTDNCVSTASTTLSLVSRKAVYIRGTLDDNGLFHVAPLDVTYSGATYCRVWTQDIPTQVDNYVYWFIGYPYYTSAYQVNLYVENPLYWFHNGRFEEYRPASTIAWTDITNKPSTATSWPNWNQIQQSGANNIEEGTSDVTANTEIFTSYASNNGFADSNAVGKVYRRDASKVVNATLVKAALGTVGTTAKKFLKDTGAWTQVAFSDLSGTATNAQLAHSKVTIAGNDVSLGGSLSAATLTSSLGLSNALHFIGITSTTLTDGSTTTTLTAKSTNSLSKTTGFVDGDVVMDGDQLREYVWSGSAWRLLGITTSTAYTQPASTATNTWIAQVSQGTDGKITATTGSLNTSGTWSGVATKASYPEGFSSRSTNATWGNQTGATVTCWNESDGGSIDIRKNNPSSGKVSIKVDGRFYGNEGNNPAMLMSDPNSTSYWGMGNPDGANNVWIRTTSLGILPFQSGGASAGHGGIGTSSWYFASSYIQNMYGTHTGNVVTSSITHRDGGNIDNGSWVTGATGTAPTATTEGGNTTYSGATIGSSVITLGNNKVGANSASGVANNSQGFLRLYSSGSAYGELTGYTTSARTHIHASTGISLPENIIDIMFRPGSSSYYTHIAYETSGNEALVAATQNIVTSFIFVNGESYANVATDRWTKLTGASGAGNAPGLQIKQNCVSIGELIPSGTNATYKLNVNGISNFKGNMTSTGNFYTSGRHISLINGVETDQFIDFAYAADPTVSTAPGASWRIGALNSGSGDGNYFVIQTGGSATNATTWNNALRLGMNTYDAGFGGNVYPLTNNNKTLGTSSLKWNNVYATTFTGNLTGNATSADSAKWLMNRGGSTVTISDGPWAHGQTGSGGTNAATVWHQRWKQSGLTYTPSGGSATTLTDSGDMVLWLAQSATSNALTVNMAIDGIIYAMGGFKGNLNGQASTVARATFGDSSNGEHNANNIKSNGMWYYTSNGPATTLGASTGDGAIYSQAYSTSWAGQIAQDYRDGALFVRGLNSGTWKNWYAIPKFTTTTGGLGSTTQPVYIDTNGELQACTAYSSASVNYAASAGSVAWANTGHPSTFPPTIGTTATTAMAGNTTVTNVSFTSASDNAEYPILMKNSTGATTTAAGTKFNTGVTINPSDSTVTASEFIGNIKANKIIPIIKKTWASNSYYATAASQVASTWFFISVKPDSWYKPWRVRFKIRTYCPGHTNCDSVTYSTYSGRADSYIAHNWNERYDHAHYYTTIRMLKNAGFTAGLGHALGVSILYANGYTNSGYYRTFELEYYDCEGCTVTVLDNPVLWTEWANGTDTNYGGYSNFNAVDRGLQESGDATGDTSDRTLQTPRYLRFKSGAAGIGRYTLVMEESTGVYSSITTTFATSSQPTTITNMAMNTSVKYRIGRIFWHNQNADRAANTNIAYDAQYWQQYDLIDIRFSFNVTMGELTAYAPFYMVGTLDSDGLFTLNPAATAWTQTLPASANGNTVYIYLGTVYPDTSTYRVALELHHPIYRSASKQVNPGDITGNASTATSAGKWTTARTLTIGNTGKSVDGSGNVSWSLTEIGAAASGHNHNGTYVPNAAGANDVNTLYNTGIYNITSGSLTNGPRGYGYGQLLVMSYRKHTGNTTTDWATQIYSHLGSGNNGNTLYYRTSNASAWQTWQMAAHADAGTAKGGAKKPIYIDAQGAIQEGTELKNLAYKDSLSASDVGALASTTKYAASSSVGGAATYAATTANTSDSIYPVGVKSGATTTLLHDTSITMKGGAISATTYTVNSHVTLQYNTTDSSLDFIFT